MFKFITKRFKKNKFQEQIERDFINGKILLPQEERDYEDYKEFKEKTKDIESINKRLVRLHGEK